MTRIDDSKSSDRPERGYLSELHLPLIAILFVLCIALGALGFILRPGTDRPLAVPPYQIQLNAFQDPSLKSNVAAGPEVQYYQFNANQARIVREIQISRRPLRATTIQTSFRFASTITSPRMIKCLPLTNLPTRRSFIRCRILCARLALFPAGVAMSFSEPSTRSPCGHTSSHRAW